MKDICFIDGEYKHVEDVEIKPDNIGVLRGYGIFEFFRTYNGRFFRFNQHMDRLFNSGEVMSINIPYKREEIEEISKELKERNDMENCSIRVLITGGRTTGHASYDPDNPTFMVLCEEPHFLPEEYYEEGVELITLEHQRILPEVKYTNYILPISKKKELEDKDKFDFLYTYQGKILESVTSSFVLVKDGKLITPKEDVLKGTTREFVLEIMEDECEIVKREIKVEELKEADEAFLTATNKEVLPVVKVDNIVIGDGKVGEVTKKALSLFRSKIENF
ncbi:MAG: aminotransferase class IV [Patescibacteria group bacterium]